MYQQNNEGLKPLYLKNPLNLCFTWPVCAFLGEIIFDRRASNMKRDAGVRSQKRLTYEEAVEEAGKFDGVVVSVCSFVLWGKKSWKPRVEQ